MIELKKKTRLLLTVTLLLTVLFGMTITANAIETRASSYFGSYSAWLTKNSSGTISVTIDVTAVNTMTSLGATSVKIQKYNSTSGTWSTVSTFSSTSTTSLLGSNVSSYSKKVTTDSSMSSGTYRAYITFYALNSSGSATTYYTTDSLIIS